MCDKFYGLAEEDLKFKDGYSIKNVWFNHDDLKDYSYCSSEFRIRVKNKWVELERNTFNDDNGEDYGRWYCGFKVLERFPWEIKKKYLPTKKEVQEALWITYGKYLDMTKKEFCDLITEKYV